MTCDDVPVCDPCANIMERKIFLDIDGVLTSFRSCERLDRTCIVLLDELVEATGADLVLTSSWRDCYGLDETRRRLAAGGLRARLTAAAPALPRGTRSDEIDAFLGRLTRRVAFVILDDVRVDDRQEAHLVLIDDFVGLSSADVINARRILAREARD